MTTPDAPEIQVAVGVIQRDDGKVLLAERPAGKAMAGYWEFPGGKIEANEAPAHALARELHEELGIEIDGTRPWISRIYRYPHATAHLHLFRVLRWHGEPHGREDQQLAWQDPQAIEVGPLLPANHSIMNALRLPAVYAITHAAGFGVDEFLVRLHSALQQGLRLVQVREKEMTADERETFTRQVVEAGHRYGARVLVNGDHALAETTGADGVHLQASQHLSLSTRPDLPLWGASCHNREELLHAAGLGADFAVLSPVLPTGTHPGAATLGWAAFATMCGGLPMPVYALGGMQPDMLDIAQAHNAHGIALLSGAW